jgi:hypothetical protein
MFSQNSGILGQLHGISFRRSTESASHQIADNKMYLLFVDFFFESTMRIILKESATNSLVNFYGKYCITPSYNCLLENLDFFSKVL